MEIESTYFIFNHLFRDLRFVTSRKLIILVFKILGMSIFFTHSLLTLSSEGVPPASVVASVIVMGNNNPLARIIRG